MDDYERNSIRAGSMLVPFACLSALAWVAVIVGTSIDWPQYALAAALLALAGALAVAARRRPSGGTRGRVLASLVFLAAVALLRNSAGGISSGAAVLSLIPVLYTALHGGGRRELYVVFAGMAVFYLAPIVIVGAPAYPQTQYRAALLTLAVSSIVGLTTQALVAGVRRQASESRMRERMLEQVSEVVRDLFTSSQVRVDVCDAVMRISHATIALIYEPLGEHGAMRTSAIAGFEAEPIEIPAGSASAVHEVFASARAALVTEDVQARVGSRELWEAAGCPQSVLYEPLLRDGRPVGVLVVGWPGEIRAAGTRATVAALLAHEAAAVIDRADALDELTGMAQSDPLTGLPNRRAWDAHLGQALGSGAQLTVAMLDFDHFKEFNDTHGHPAGDRLLRETAALWRDQLRSGDVLARLGGEEFGLLLLNCDPQRAQDVIDRLRGAVSRGRTCSAGFAVRRPGEAADAVMARADAALYEAKAAGRDRACMSA